MKTQNLNFPVTFLFIFLLVTSVFSSSGQEKKKILEVSTPSFTDGFSLRYKFGNTERLFRINYSFLNFSKGDRMGNDYDSNRFGAGIGVGVEFPKNINDKLQVYYGTEVGSAFINYNDQNKQQSFDISLKGVLGFAYYLNQNLRLGAEITPEIFYKHSKTNSNSKDIYGFSAQSSLAEFVLGICF